MYEDDGTFDEALEATTAESVEDDPADDLGDGISMPTLQRGSEH